MPSTGAGGASASSLGVPHSVQVHPQSGSLGVAVPLELTPGRGGFGPQLALEYHSSGANGSFGRGWSLSGLLAVSVDSSHGLPRYDGTDVYALAGAGELVPYATATADAWEDRGAFRVLRYRARFERGFQRIERWQEKAGGRVHWRIRDARDTLTVLGARDDGSSRVFDPARPERVHTWLPELQIDAQGNAILYGWASESYLGVDGGRPEESGRVRSSLPPAHRYLKSIQWGNTAPVGADGALPAGQRWSFQLVLDYGDHDPADPRPLPDRAWPVRPDPFSSYAAGFEVRQYRLCRRLLLFHAFPELGPAPVRVQTHALEHEERPEGCLLARIRRAGHRLDGAARTSKERPPLAFTYSAPRPGAAFLPAPVATLTELPLGLEGPSYRLVDLYGEGLPGILVERPEAWAYRRNLGGGRFAPEALVVERPAHALAQVAVEDFDGDGNTELVVHGSRSAGFYALDRETGSWSGFTPFPSIPHLDADIGAAQLLDLDGDGLSDLVLGGADRLTWYPSLGREGFDRAVTVQPVSGAGAAPFRDAAALDFFFADMTGDGLLDQVLVRDGSVVYWPNLGQGRFGAPVTMDGAPRFAPDGQFDAGRLLFADLDGSGTTDLVYVGDGEVTTWTNAGGNALLPGRTIRGLPQIDQQATLRVFDFLGDGTPCLVWSQTTGAGAAALQYLPLTDGVRPGLLVGVDNSLGAERRITYASSAAHYLRDAADGRRWDRKLPRHVVVVDALEVVDRIGGARAQHRYRYHDGSYDGRERHFRGFGFVEVQDDDPQGEAAEVARLTAASCTRTWFHLGAEGVPSQGLRWAGDPQAPSLVPHVVEAPDPLTADEAEDALAALAGQPVRTETFALAPDGTVGAVPLQVEDTGYLVRRLQPATRRSRASFAVFERERLTGVHEQAALDPRLLHHLVLETDALGAAVTVCDVAYARRAAGPAADPAQRRTEVTVNQLVVQHVDEPGRVQLAAQVEAREYDLAGLEPAPGAIFRWQELRGAVAAALAAPVAFDAQGAAPGAARRVGWSRTWYWNGAGTDALPLGQTAAPLRLHHVERAAFTPGLVAGLYAGKVDAARLAAAGYREADGHWWSVGETFTYGDASAFCRLEEIRRADGGATALFYDAGSFRAVRTLDAVGSEVRVELDYHLLAPRRTVDENGAITEVRYDPLGVAVATAIRGEVADGAGGTRPYGSELLAGFALPAGATPESALADPAGHVQDLASVTLYDVDRWATQGKPPVVVTLLRENPRHDGSGVPQPPGDVSVLLSYHDGFGRALQTKLEVEPGDAVARDAAGAVVLGPDGRPRLAPAARRWLVQGHVVYDRRQQPVLRYEPFFSSRPDFEDEEALRRFGVAHAIAYDALGRPIRHEEPNGTFSRVEHGPWQTRTFDANDTVEESTYRLLRKDLAPTAPERRAYENARAHHDTPIVVHVDPSGRTVVLEEPAPTGDRRTVSRYGPDGNLVEVIDPRGLSALRQGHDLLGREAWSASMDAGEQRVLHDALGRPVEAWSGRGLHLERTFDRLDRLVAADVSGTLDGAPLPRRRTQVVVYGDDPSVADARARNLRGRVAILRDDAGERTIELCAPGGEVLASTQRVVADVEVEPDWSNPAAVALMPEPYRTRTTFDALGRVRRQTLPDGAIQVLRHGRAGGVRELRLSTDDGLVQDAALVQAAEFNARGQRQLARLGNGVEIAHDFDPDTWRTRSVKVRRAGGPQPGLLVDLGYTYDPVGNVVVALDQVQQPGVVLPVFQGLAVTAERVFQHDAHYQLTSAQGRVHRALLPDDHRTDPANAGAVKGTRRLSFNDGGQLERYTQSYAYDLSGNMTRLVHAGGVTHWTQDFWVSPQSNRSLPALDANGLPVQSPEAAFDADGNCLRFPHLRALRWSHQDRLRAVVVIDRSGSGDPDDDEWYVSDAQGKRVRKRTRRFLGGGVVETTDVVYLEGCELKRVTRGGAPVLERKLTYVADAFHRLAEVYRWTRDDTALETANLGAARIRYTVHDHLGSAQLTLDESAAVIAYEEYLPFGGTAFLGGDDVREVALRTYRFCGKERDDATGLYAFGARYYAPWLNRWTSPDPGGFVDGLNRYVYVQNNPTTNFDPDGLQTAQNRGKEKTVYGGIPLVVHEAWAALPEAQKEAYRALMKKGNFAWFLDAATGAVRFGTRAEMQKLVEAKLSAGENVGNLKDAPAAAKPGKGGGGGGAAKKPPAPAPKKDDAQDGAGADAGAAAKGGAQTDGGGKGDAAQGQDGTQGGAKGAGGEPGDATGKGDAADPGGTKANPGDGGGDGAQPGAGGNGGDGTVAGPGGTGGEGPGLGAKGTGTGGGGTGDAIGTGSGDAPGAGSGAGTGTATGDGSGDKAQGTGTGAGDGQGGTGEQPGGAAGGSAGGKPGGKGTTPGEGGGKGTGTDPGVEGGDPQGVLGGKPGGKPGGVQAGTGADPNGSPGGKAPGGEQAGNAGSATGDPQGKRTDGGQGAGGGKGHDPRGNDRGSPQGTPGGHGQPGGKPGSGKGGEASGPPQKKTVMDYVTQVAGYWNLEFGGGDAKGASGGVPGGFGTHNWGAWGQALYVALTVADIVLTFVSLGGTAGIKAGLKAGWAAAKKAVTTVGKKLATLFTEEAVSKALTRASIKTLLAGAGTAAKKAGSRFWNWFAFWKDVGGITTPTASKKFLGFWSSHSSTIVNQDLIAAGGKWTAAAIDTAAHEGTHKVVGKFLGPIWDAGNKVIKGQYVGAGVMWAEETVAYAAGHGAAGRIHGLVTAPFEAFISVFHNVGGGAAGRNALGWAAGEVAVVGGGIAAYFGLREDKPAPTAQPATVTP